MVYLSRYFSFKLYLMLKSYNPASALTETVWALPFSLATTQGIIIYFLFLQVLRCFSSLGLLLYEVIQLHWMGFTYSEIFGLTVICTSPKLIAAYHVLHRLQEPRHPPCALNNFFVRHLIRCQVYFLSICQRT